MFALSHRGWDDNPQRVNDSSDYSVKSLIISEMESILFPDGQELQELNTNFPFISFIWWMVWFFRTISWLSNAFLRFKKETTLECFSLDGIGGRWLIFNLLSSSCNLLVCCTKWLYCCFNCWFSCANNCAGWIRNIIYINPIFCFVRCHRLFSKEKVVFYKW